MYFFILDLFSFRNIYSFFYMSADENLLRYDVMSRPRIFVFFI